MRFRLSKLGQRAWLTALGLAALNLLALLAACSGEEFTASGSPSASGSGGAGEGGDNASEAGEGGRADGGSSGAPSGGRAGSPSSGGSGGRPPVGCDCVPGEYCQDGTPTCRRCADFTRLEFGTAQKLNTLSQSPQSERFARPAGAGSALFYVSGAADEAKILYTGAPVSSIGSPVSSAGPGESAPLLVAGFQEEKNLFFDRRQTGGRQLMMARWTASQLSNEAPVPAPLNVDGSDNYSIAISPITGHVYWMSTRNGEAELLWQPTSVSAPPPPAVLELKIKAGKSECARAGEDATPWVDLAGTLLLFRNPSINDNCQANDSGATDLFAVPLDSDGVPQAAATALSSLNTTGGMSRESDPSLSADACTIYFASDSGSGDFDLYRAQRH